MTKKLKVAVLVGGPSSEHEVSLKSGEMILDGLNSKKYEAKKVLISKDGIWSIEPQDLKKYADLVFIALHGTFGEDGTIQDILESHSIPYTGSGVHTSALAMNKFLSLRLFKDHGISTPHTFSLSKLEWQTKPSIALEWIKHYGGYPVVIKPNNQGSSVGVSIANDGHEVSSALNEIFSLTRHALIQNYIRGREITCGVLDHGWPESAHPLLPTEIIPRKSNFFDYQAKYELGASDEITPPDNLPADLLNSIRRIALITHQIVNARSFSRTDMILGKQGRIFVLEINTIPGLTEDSLLPKAALATGISFQELLDRIINSSFGR